MSAATIDWRGGHYAITDVGSRNGTFVNGMRVMQQFLRNGDTITIGDCDLRFLDDASAVSDALRLVTVPGTLAELDALVMAGRRLPAFKPSHGLADQRRAVVGRAGLEPATNGL